MQRYETVFIISGNVSEQETNEIISSFEKVITGEKGKLIQTDRWGKRRFAFPIDKFGEGNYFLLFYDADGAIVKELERKMRMNENVLRFLTVRSKEEHAPKKPTDMEYQQITSTVAKEETLLQDRESEEETHEK